MVVGLISCLVVGVVVVGFTSFLIFVDLICSFVGKGQVGGVGCFCTGMGWDEMVVFGWVGG